MAVTAFTASDEARYWLRIAISAYPTECTNDTDGRTDGYRMTA